MSTRPTHGRTPSYRRTDVPSTPSLPTSHVASHRTPVGSTLLALTPPARRVRDVAPLLPAPRRLDVVCPVRPAALSLPALILVTPRRQGVVRPMRPAAPTSLTLPALILVTPRRQGAVRPMRPAALSLPALILVTPRRQGVVRPMRPAALSLPALILVAPRRQGVARPVRPAAPTLLLRHTTAGRGRELDDAIAAGASKATERVAMPTLALLTRPVAYSPSSPAAGNANADGCATPTFTHTRHHCPTISLPSLPAATVAMSTS